jgi:hypothetical protein
MKRLRDILEQSAADEGRNQVQRKRLDIPVNENAPVVSNSWKTTKSISVPKLDNYQAGPEAETSKNSFTDSIKSFFGYDSERQTKIDAFKKKWRNGDLTDRQAELFMKYQRPDPDLKSNQEPPITIINGKIQDRVPQEIPRNPIDKAPERKDSVALQRQMAGDKSPTALSFEDQLKMFRLKIDQKSKQYQKEIDAMTPGITATLDKNLTPVSNKKTPPIIVTPDKPLVTSKPNSALTAAGYDQSGKKITAVDFTGSR